VQVSFFLKEKRNVYAVIMLLNRLCTCTRYT